MSIRFRSADRLRRQTAMDLVDTTDRSVAPHLVADPDQDREPVRTSGGPRSTDKAIQKQIDRCARDVCHWLETYGWMVNPKDPDPERRVHQFKLWPGQKTMIRRMLEGYRAGDNRIVNKSRELGVSWITVHLLVWLWIFEPNFQALMLSKEGESVDDGTHKSLMGKARFVIYRQPDFLIPEGTVKSTQTPSVIHNRANGSEIAGKNTTGGAPRGLRTSIVLSDEWAHVQRTLQSRIRLALQSVSRSWWRVSTPGGRGDDFHISWVHATDDQRILLPWQTDPRRDEAWWDGRLKENGGDLTKDERAQEFGCSFGAVLGERVFIFERVANSHGLKVMTAKRRKLLPSIAAMDFGTGPSWTVILFALIDWGKGEGNYPRIYLDSEIVWTRAPAPLVARDIIAHHKEAGYAMSTTFVGDPAGASPESDQGSWESRLQTAGVPMRCLPAEFNEHKTLYVDSIDHVQDMLNLGLLSFDPETVPYATEAAESWEWDTPVGIDARFLNRATIRPKKDSWSHMMNALQYLVESVVRGGRMIPSAEVLDKLATTGGRVSQVLGRVRTSGRGRKVSL